MLKRFTFALALTLAATAQAQANHGKDFDHTVRFEVGETHSLDGDSVTIDSITGTADSIKSGNLYQVKGHYKLSSQASAMLALNVTTYDKETAPNSILPLNHVSVEQGEGSFTIYFFLNGKGWPHLSFYPAHGGESFSTLYFGNGPSLHRTANEGPHD